MIATPKHKHWPIQMERVLRMSDFCKAGQFKWKISEQGYRTLVLAVPHTNPSGWLLTEWTIDHKNDCDAQWSFDGNEKRPTLTPSLHAKGIWHGYVTAGMLVEA